MRNRFLWILFLSTLGFSQSGNQNYIVTKIYKTAQTSPLPSVPSIADASTQVSYFDGLGRPIQSINYAQAPDGGDIISHIEYDAFGRQEKDYLPYVRTNTSLNFEPDLEPQIEPFYQDLYANETTPYSQKEFEASPLNRVLKQAAPGEAWKLGSNHEIKFDYQANTANDLVVLFAVQASWNPGTALYDIPTFLNTNNKYPANELYKNITVDENNVGFDGARTEEFKDKQDRVVLKRIYARSNGSALERYDTYYVYDQFGNLSFVIPPKVDTDANIGAYILNNLCYQYKYDYRNRLVAKKIPGKTWEFIVYDKLDRVRATGPVLAPFNNTNNSGWLWTKYDAFDRPILTMFVDASSISENTRKSLQASVDNASSISEHKTTQTHTVNGVSFRYSNTSYPTSAFFTLSINYYDDYEFPNAPADFSTVLGQTVRNGQNNTCKGLSTGSWTRVLNYDGNTGGTTSYTLYLNDPRVSPVKTYSTNYIGGHTEVLTLYDNFEGKVLQTQTQHQRNSSAQEITINETFAYTDQGRLDYQTHEINNSGNVERIVKNNYDVLGNMTNKEVGNTAGNSHQSVNYSYNIRGWLTDIKPRDIDPMFTFHIKYNNPNNGATPLYNGNISETYWLTNSDNNTRMYKYNYDDLNRLELAEYQNLSVTNTKDTYNESLTYDKNGNILSLQRNGGFENTTNSESIDELSYTYYNTSNQLKRVLDASNSIEGFEDVSSGDTDYTYDTHGNMTSDVNKNITHITYNHLNLPKKISFQNNNYIEYTYDASGVKLKKKVTENNTISVTDYLDGFQYNNSKLQFFPHAEGYVKHTLVGDNNDISIFKYVYQYKDHLGNVRVNYTLENGSLVILDEHHYYPFGLEHGAYNPIRKEYREAEDGVNNDIVIITEVENSGYQYKYNGKELQDELGLSVYDYGARIYDPAAPRFWQIDPLAEVQYSYSPYHYTYNNPILYNDPTGMIGEKVTTWVVNKKTNERIWIDDGYYFDFYVSDSDFAEISSTGAIPNRLNWAWNKEFWRQVWQELTGGEGIVNFVIIDEIESGVEVIDEASNGNYTKATLLIFLKKVQKAKKGYKLIKKLFKYGKKSKLPTPDLNPEQFIKKAGKFIPKKTGAIFSKSTTSHANTGNVGKQWKAWSKGTTEFGSASKKSGARISIDGEGNVVGN